MHDHQQSTTTPRSSDSVTVAEPRPAVTPAEYALRRIRESIDPASPAPPAVLSRIAIDADLTERQVRALAARYLEHQFGVSARDLTWLLGVEIAEVYRYLRGVSRTNERARIDQAAYRARQRQREGDTPAHH